MPNVNERKDKGMDEAIKSIDFCIERRGECLIGRYVSEFMYGPTEPLVNELKARGYVIRPSRHLKDGSGYVVYPKRKSTQPWMSIEVI